MGLQKSVFEKEVIISDSQTVSFVMQSAHRLKIGRIVLGENIISEKGDANGSQHNYRIGKTPALCDFFEKGEGGKIVKEKQEGRD